MSDYTPLDPEEGPTVWATQDESNNYTYHIAVGEDPDDPRETFFLSEGEIERLNKLVEETQ